MEGEGEKERELKRARADRVYGWEKCFRGEKREGEDQSPQGSVKNGLKKKKSGWAAVATLLREFDQNMDIQTQE